MAGATLKIKGDSKDLVKDLDKSTKKVEKFGKEGKKSVEGVNKAAKSAKGGFGVAGAAAAVAAIGVASFAKGVQLAVRSVRTLTTLTVKTVQNLDDIAKSAERIGITTEEFQKLAFASRRTGSTTSNVERAFKKMSSIIDDLGQGLSTATIPFKRLGIEFDQIAGRSPERQFSIIVKELGKIEDATTKSAIAQDLFGRAGMSITPMINQYGDLVDRLEEINGLINKDSLKAAEDLKDAWEDVSTATLALAGNSGFLQYLTTVAEKIDAIAMGLKRADFKKLEAAGVEAGIEVGSRGFTGFGVGAAAGPAGPVIGAGIGVLAGIVEKLLGGLDPLKEIIEESQIDKSKELINLEKIFSSIKGADNLEELNLDDIEAFVNIKGADDLDLNINIESFIRDLEKSKAAFEEIEKSSGKLTVNQRDELSVTTKILDTVQRIKDEEVLAAKAIESANKKREEALEKEKLKLEVAQAKIDLEQESEEEQRLKKVEDVHKNILKDINDEMQILRLKAAEKDKEIAQLKAVKKLQEDIKKTSALTSKEETLIRKEAGVEFDKNRKMLNKVLTDDGLDPEKEDAKNLRKREKFIQEKLDKAKEDALRTATQAEIESVKKLAGEKFDLEQIANKKVPKEVFKSIEASVFSTGLGRVGGGRNVKIQEATVISINKEQLEVQKAILKALKNERSRFPG